MKQESQEQQIISMMKRPIPKKKVGIIKLKMVREGAALYGMDRFHEARQAVDTVQSLFQYSDREMLVVMSLDTALTPIAVEIIAASVICFHNHPFGNLEVSNEDSQITERMKAAGDLLGIVLIDRIIIGTNREYISFKESCIPPFRDGKGAA